MENNNVNLVDLCNIPTNVSGGKLIIEIGELSVKGVTLKGLKATGGIALTDENAHVEADAAMRLLGMLVDKFGDHINALMDTEIKRQERRMRNEEEYEAARQAREEAQVKMYDAQRRAADAEAAKTEAEIEKIKAETEAIVSGAKTNK